MWLEDVNMAGKACQRKRITSDVRAYVDRLAIRIDDRGQ
jgi:hypothetical protein